MSEQQHLSVHNEKKSGFVVKPLKTPILIKKKNINVFNSDDSHQLLIKNIKFGPASSLYKEDVIYESKESDPYDFLRDSPGKIVIINRLDLLKCTSRTVLKHFNKDGKESQKTSDGIVKFIGQSNYDAVLSALVMVKDERTKVKAVIALLTSVSMEDKDIQVSAQDKERPCDINLQKPNTEEKSCQTEDNSMELIYKFKQKRRIARSSVTPYVVKNDEPPKKVIKKVIVNPTFQNHQLLKDVDKTTSTIKSETEISEGESKMADTNELPVLHENLQLNDDNFDNCSMNNGSLGAPSIVLDDPFVMKCLDGRIKEPTLDPQSFEHYIMMQDKSRIPVPVKPEYPFHIATPEILKYLSKHDKIRVLEYQVFLDIKYCMEKDADGYLPIHHAVLNNDVLLLKRMCAALRYRRNSVDIACGNLTALQMSIYQDTPECTAMLLQNGADPLNTDEEHRTCLHLASESTSDHLRAILNHCESCARNILQEHDELWKEEYEKITDTHLALILLDHICALVDSQGYTPLMLAAKTGNYTGVKMLIEASPHCVNIAMPNCGDTALFQAVRSASLDADNRLNKSKVADHYYQTISILLENSADWTAVNYAGTSVNDLLVESANAELCKLFGNKVTSVNYFDGHLPGGSKFDDFMLYKKSESEVSIAKVTSRPSKPKKLNIIEIVPITSSSNQLVMNRVLKPIDATRISPKDDIVMLKNHAKNKKASESRISKNNVVLTFKTQMKSCVSDFKTMQTNASSSQTITSASQRNASALQTNSSVSQTNASASQINSSVLQTNASASQTNPSVSQTKASASQTIASASQTIASASQTNTCASESNISTLQINTGASHTNASASQTNSSASESNISASQTKTSLSQTKTSLTQTKTSLSQTKTSLLSQTNPTTSQTNTIALHSHTSESPININASQTKISLLKGRQKSTSGLFFDIDNTARPTDSKNIRPVKIISSEVVKKVRKRTPFLDKRLVINPTSFKNIKVPDEYDEVIKQSKSSIQPGFIHPQVDVNDVKLKLVTKVVKRKPSDSGQTRKKMKF